MYIYMHHLILLPKIVAGVDQVAYTYNIQHTIYILVFLPLLAPRRRHCFPLCALLLWCELYDMRDIQYTIYRYRYAFPDSSSPVDVIYIYIYNTYIYIWIT